MRDFDLNSIVLFVTAGVIILFVIAQSVFFLRQAWRRARELGIEARVLRRVARSSVVFTIAPAIAIILGVITLSRFLGLPLPWLRLSVLGALTYELPAATSAAAALGVPVSEGVTDPKTYSTIAWVMTLGIMSGLIIVTLFLKKIQGGIQSLKKRDTRWGEIFLTALFMGMISAFLGMIFADITAGLKGWIPVFVMIISSLLMLICGFFVKVLKVKWMEDYALPISMLGAMALSIPITRLLG
ncbi:MAG TPA: DUF5058 family protein [Bacillota bacterium]|nr:DUF5058 family protein [Bacillota bacterium]HOA35431.1 DUF5058 family protein [Bacillota bacterium]HOJ84355.1 DUF5058 family protein [Bacillota bacterium]HPZ11776.1 DUF5058 family protein [Bacillota bacterium]HQE10005.1 DUF5058 family protein [Bacillota bacterium]